MFFTHHHWKFYVYLYRGTNVFPAVIMSSVEHIEALTRHAETLLNVVNGEDAEEDGGHKDVADTLESFRRGSALMTSASDLDVALLTVKSIIYKVRGIKSS